MPKESRSAGAEVCRWRVRKWGWTQRGEGRADQGIGGLGYLQYYNVWIQSDD